MLDYFDCNKIIKNHGLVLPNGQVYLTKPLGVFKKVRTPAKQKRESLLGGKNVRLIDTDIQIVNKVKTHASVVPGYELEDAIANLVLPVGTIVNLAQNNSCKMRASQAICWSISEKYSPRSNVEFAYPTRRYVPFVYMPFVSGRTGGGIADYEKMAKFVSDNSWMKNIPNAVMVTPDFPFDPSTEECASGIHFFLESSKALSY